MEALLHSMGYYRDTITYRAEIDTAGAQYRTIVNFRVTPGTQFKVDSLAYNFRYDTIVSISQPTKDTLQQVTNDALGTALLKKGDAFAKPQIAAERERNKIRSAAKRTENRVVLVDLAAKTFIIWCRNYA